VLAAHPRAHGLERAVEEDVVNKKEFNVFFIEDPARNTRPLLIASITRYENGSRLLSEAALAKDAFSEKSFALIRMAIRQLATEDAELRHPFTLGAHVCIVPEDMTWGPGCGASTRRGPGQSPGSSPTAGGSGVRGTSSPPDDLGAEVVLKLNAYQATNLREVLRAILEKESPYSPLNTGDWCGELRRLLERLPIAATPNRSAEDLVASAKTTKIAGYVIDAPLPEDKLRALEALLALDSRGEAYLKAYKAAGVVVVRSEDVRSTCEGYNCEAVAMTARTDLGGTTFALCEPCAAAGKRAGYWRPPAECDECEGEHLVRASRWSDVMIPCPTCGGKS
jgi:hypothetical protein